MKKLFAVLVLLAIVAGGFASKQIRKLKLMLDFIVCFQLNKLRIFVPTILFSS